MPYAYALGDIADEKFSVGELLNPEPIEARMTAMESRFETLANGMQELLSLQRGDGFVSAQESHGGEAAKAAPKKKAAARRLQSRQLQLLLRVLEACSTSRAWTPVQSMLRCKQVCRRISFVACQSS